MVGAEPERAALAWAEDADPEVAATRARQLVGAAESVVSQRRTEAGAIFTGEVDAEHEAVYRQALMSLLWSQSLYR